MAEAPATLRAQQLALSSHLRDPAAVAPPGGIEDRRLGIYRELLYNNIQGLLASNFPVIRRTLADDDWHALV
ncbi:MAG TPA: DNA-binding domain-containing protein, partial [Luteimonas sp.]|nr:DNA-binding domain-containing protein [Luteimonas sp.]